MDDQVTYRYVNLCELIISGLLTCFIDPELQPKAEPEETVDPTKKRKHHITYLAERAKATEQELKAAWATSKNNRMMSRAKYGF